MSEYWRCVRAERGHLAASSSPGPQEPCSTLAPVCPPRGTSPTPEAVAKDVTLEVLAEVPFDARLRPPLPGLTRLFERRPPRQVRLHDGWSAVHCCLPPTRTPRPQSRAALMGNSGVGGGHPTPQIAATCLFSKYLPIQRRTSSVSPTRAALGMHIRPADCFGCAPLVFLCNFPDGVADGARAREVRQ